MKKITLKDGSLLFLPDEYMESMLRVIPDSLGDEAAELVAEWAEEERPDLRAVSRLRDEVSYHTAMYNKLSRELEAERESHEEDVAELEDELASMRDVYVMLLNTNSALTAKVKMLEAEAEAAWTPVAEGETCATCRCSAPPHELVYCTERKSYHFACQQKCGAYKEKE